MEKARGIIEPLFLMNHMNDKTIKFYDGVNSPLKKYDQYTVNDIVQGITQEGIEKKEP